MFRPWLTSVRGEVSGERALEAVRAITRFHRVQSSPGLDQAVDWLAEALERAGLEVDLERVAGDGRTQRLGQVMPQGWSCDRAWADLIDGGRRERLCDVEAEPLSLVIRSASGRGRFPLIDVGEGSEPEHYDGRDVRGRVVLAHGEVHRVHQLAVLDRGAAGLLTDTRRLVPPVRERHDERSALNYTSFWWVGDEPRGWGLVVSPEAGDALRERLAHGASLTIEVEIDARAFDTTVPLLSGRCAGASPSEVVVVSHLCHPMPSANDNASGAAANLEAARALAALHARGEPAALHRSLRFLWVPELTGTCAFFGSDAARAARTTAALNLDMVGENQERCGSTFLLEHPPASRATFAEALLGEIRREAVDWVSSYSGPGHYSMTRMAEVPFGGGSDHVVFIHPGVGVPCPMLIQWPDRFYHSNHDTLDKCDSTSLALAARCAATYAGFLASAGAREASWLQGLVGRRARRRILEGLERADPARQVELELLRGTRALASLERLDVPAAARAEAEDELRRFAERETVEIERRPRPPSRSGRRPRRLGIASLGFQRRLLPGWSELPREAREAWRRRELETAEAYVLAELAWHACDGRRTIEEIEDQVWLETGERPDGFAAALFDLTARLGLSDWIA